MSKIFLVCTGLGIVERGFESYIYSLATKLAESKFDFLLFSSNKLNSTDTFWKKIPAVSRKNKMFNFFFGYNITSEIELITFFFPLCIHILKKKPSVIYLGEYNLYCYLFKFRSFFKLNFALTLYTGGQVVPGIFDKKKDFVHHVTNIYIDTLRQNGFPDDHQFLIPHFVSNNFKVNDSFVESLRTKISPKKIILSVGIIDRDIKRMDLLIRILANAKDTFFPIILGEASEQTKNIIEEANFLFGDNQFIITKVNRNELANYYKAADAFVLLSPKESFGLVYLEALEAGLPVIACDFQESRFVLMDSVKYISDDQLLQLPTYLKTIIESNNIDEAKKRNEFVLDNYSWKKLKPAYLNMFNIISKGFPSVKENN